MEKLKFNVKLDRSSFEVLNSEFTKAKCTIMYTGKNRNNSSISKEAVESALSSLYNTPVVAEYLEQVEDFGTHGGKIQIEDGELKYIQTTVPYGVVPESCNPRWEMITEDDGQEREYLVADVILWSGRYEELEKTVSEYSNQSMEINVYEGEFNRDRVYEINKFEFSALCILGQEVEACFESAKIMAYSINEFKLDMDEFMKKYKAFEKQLFAISSDEVGSEDSIDIVNSSDDATDSPSWGDVDKNSERDKLMKKSNYKALMNEFYLILKDEPSSDNPNPDGLYPHHVERDGKLVIHIGGVESASAFLAREDTESSQEAIDHINRHREELGMDKLEFNKGGETVEKFELTLNQKLQLLNESIVDTVTKDENGEEIAWTYYWVMDADSEYVYVNKYGRNEDGDCFDSYVRMNYTMSEDNSTVTINMESEVKIVKGWMTEEEQNMLEQNRQSELTQMQAEFGEKVVEFEDTIKNLNTTIEELNVYKEKYELIQEESRKSEIQYALDEFEEELKDVEEFNMLKNKAFSLDIEDVKKECFAIIGRLNHKVETTNKPNKNISFSKVLFEGEEDDDTLSLKQLTDKYGDMAKFFNKGK